MMNVGDSINADNANWRFNGETVTNFDSHISKSVPLYEKGHELIIRLSDFFLAHNSICYELGCSTGALINKIAKHNNFKDCEYIGVDIEKDMIDFAKRQYADSQNITFICEDLLNVDFKKGDLFVSYYTIQFVRPKVRQILIDRIYDSLNWGGGFLYFEKVRASDARFQDIITSLYTDYKLDNGFSCDEIIAKSRSLKGVLEPFSTQGNIDLLKRAGFVDIISVMKYLNFEGFLAIK